MENNQLEYIKYAAEFAENNKIHIWLGGSFLYGSATLFSDVDISVCCNAEDLKNLIYGYGQPVYISYTSNPLGILIVIYADGVALDLEIIEKVDITDGEYFHRADIKTLNYIREENLCRQFALGNNMTYQISRLFHRSLIKFLSGKKDIGVSVANEIVTFMNSQDYIDEIGYKKRFIDILKKFDEQFHLPTAYYKLLCELIENLNKVDCQ